MVFIDDILICSPSCAEHVTHIRMVLDRLREHHFFVKKTKCVFGIIELIYLGHIISQQGVATYPFKTEAMKNWPTPTSVTELRFFWGLTGYYRSGL
jgi:hypothetical protein